MPSPPPSLLLSVLPYHLHYLSITKSSLPKLCFALIKLIIQAPSHSSFVSWTETDDSDVSLLVEQKLLNTLVDDLHSIGVTVTNNHTDTSSTHSDNDAPRVTMIGKSLRAIQVVEGYESQSSLSLISEVSGSLALAGFSIFYVSTNRADFVLVQSEQLTDVLECLAQSFLIVSDDSEKHDNDSEDGSDESRSLISQAANKSQSIHTNIANDSHTDPVSVSGENFSSESDSSAVPRTLDLRVLPYSLLMQTMTGTEIAALTAPLLSLIFFTQPRARFFSYTVLDKEFSIIAEASDFEVLLSLNDQSRQSTTTRMASLSAIISGSERWNVIEAVGVFDYEETGLVSTIAKPLTQAGLRFFYYSSWRTGFVLVHQEDLETAKSALQLK